MQNKNGVQDLEKLISQDPYLNEPLIESLSRNVSESLHLNFLQLCSLKFSQTSWSLVANALKKNCTIQILILNAMNIKESSWEILSPAFAVN